MRDYSTGTPPSFWRLFWKTGGVIPVFLAAFTIILSLVSSSGLYLAEEMEAKGEETVGRVISRETKVVRRNDRTEREYYVTMTYFADGEEITKRESVTGTLYQQLSEGTERKVRYLPGRPQVVEFEIGSNRDEGTTLRWVALMFGVLTLGVGWYLARKAVAMIRARKFGPHETGQVVEVKRKRGAGSTGYVLIWRDARGVEGHSLKSKGDARYAPYRTGGEVDLFRDAKDRVWWSGDVGGRG